MNKGNTQNLESIIRTINKHIVSSFLITLIFFVIAISVSFEAYRDSEEKLASHKLNSTFSAFAFKISEKLLAIAMEGAFVEYLNSGWISRESLYSLFLNDIYHTSLLNIIAGMDMFDSNGVNIFSYGIKTNDSVVLSLCYLNRRIPNFDVGNCTHSWRLYFKHDAMIKELKALNPELIDCANCNKKIISGNFFGNFPLLQISGMEAGLCTKKSHAIFLWEMVAFMVALLLILTVWNVNRIKIIFKTYLSDPVVEITSKIKENKVLPRVAIEELSYLTEQIERWKEQTIELETVRVREKAKEDKAKAMQSIGASIAHELRTPMLSIISGVSGIEKNLPALLEGYDLARKYNLPIRVIQPHQVELLHKVLSNLKAESMAINMIIDMLLIKITDSISKTTCVEKLSINECLSEALQRYAFQESERSLVVCDTTNDFQFKGNKLLVVHILFNLLKNALYYIASVRKGRVYVHLEHGKNENTLHFMDTGKGIPEKTLSHIFDRFYSKTEGGAGIGLSFCKMAMEWMNGDITCQSVEGEYTEFVLHFPISRG
jgi:signal transduction histidine kinase